MSRGDSGIVEQLRRNAVALISLVVAVSSLSYNTWRNEKTEHNRNQRTAGFEMLLKLGELQELVFFAHYEEDLADRGNPRSGWALVLTIRDLGQVLGEPLPQSSRQLLDIWSGNWEGLGAKDASADAIRTEIESVRMETLAHLRSLE